MLTQRIVIGGVRNLLTYSKYRIYRKNILLSAVTPQINSCSPFHQSSICATRYAGVSRKAPGMEDAEVVRIYRSMTIGELAETLKKTNEYVIKRVENAKIMECNENLQEHTIIDHEVFIRNEALLLGYKVEIARRRRKTEKEGTLKIVSKNSALVPRPPVVTIMGHVDHGKTTLLDTLRKSNIVAKEFGGITQHIGAFLVTLPSGENITFLDTPGHAAFSAMRARGAKLTDIIILVVAADDGISPQTIESIEHARKANVPIIVALNKIDKVNGNYEKLKLSLMEHDVIVEEAGGNVQLIKISALKGTNIHALQEAVVAQAELMELNGDPTGVVQGSVVESEFHNFLGRIATIIIQKGVLRVGDFIVSGNAYAKVRKMLNEHSQELDEAGLSIPVRVVGWRSLPSPGEQFHQVSNERDARNYISLKDKEIRENKTEVINPVWEEAKRKLREYYLRERKKKLAIGREGKNWHIYHVPAAAQHSHALGGQTITSHRGPHLSIMLICDVEGSLEAIKDVLAAYSSTMCELTILESKVGNINKAEIDLAILSNAIIYGFNIKPSSDILEYAKENKVKIKMHNVIYKFFDCLKSEINSQLPSVTEEEEQKGEAAFLSVFDIEAKKKMVRVIGCKCTDGKLFAEGKFRVLRGSEVKFDGNAVSLNIKKAPVDSVDVDQECGLVLDGFNGTLQKGDKIVCYTVNRNTTQLDWDPGFTNPKS